MLFVGKQRVEIYVEEKDLEVDKATPMEIVMSQKTLFQQMKHPATQMEIVMSQKDSNMPCSLVTKPQQENKLAQSDATNFYCLYFFKK